MWPRRLGSFPSRLRAGGCSEQTPELQRPPPLPPSALSSFRLPGSCVCSAKSPLRPAGLSSYDQIQVKKCKAFLSFQPVLCSLARSKALLSLPSQGLRDGFTLPALCHGTEQSGRLLVLSFPQPPQVISLRICTVLVTVSLM